MALQAPPDEVPTPTPDVLDAYPAPMPPTATTPVPGQSGIRLQQDGSIWTYAGTALLGLLFTVLTLGLYLPFLQVKLIRYAVVAGEEQTHTTVNLPFPARLDSAYRVRVEVKGPKFTTSVQGRPVDFWTDTQLLSGGVGFLNDREERGRIESVQISF